VQVRVLPAALRNVVPKMELKLPKNIYTVALHKRESLLVKAIRFNTGSIVIFTSVVVFNLVRSIYFDLEVWNLIELILTSAFSIGGVIWSTNQMIFLKKELRELGSEIVLEM
jgi:hypothetical protein